MRFFIVYAHPEEQSFNGALKDTAVKTLTDLGHDVVVTDLYGENFNPVPGRHDFTTTQDTSLFHFQKEQGHAAEQNSFAPDIAREQKRLDECDVLIFIFPLWWSNMPAILKGWVDRVAAFGVFYKDGLRFERGMLKGKKAIACVTTGGTLERFSETGPYGPIEDVLKSVNRSVFEYLGMDVLPSFISYAAPRVEEDERKEFLKQWAERLHQIAHDKD